MVELQHNLSDNQQFVTLMQLTEDSGALVTFNQTQSLFTVDVGGKVIYPVMSSVVYSTSISCPPGSVYKGFCADCPEGMKEVNGQCVFCPLGQYQDEPGSTTCKTCPGDLSWDLEGALDVSQCAFPNMVTKSPVPDVDESNATKTGIIIGTVCGVLGIAGVIAGLSVYFYKKSKRGIRNTTRNGSLFSLQSLATVYPEESHPSSPPPYSEAVEATLLPSQHIYLRERTKKGSLLSAHSLDKLNSADPHTCTAPSYGEASEDTIPPSRHNQKTTLNGSLFSANSLDKSNSADTRPCSAQSYREASEDTILPNRHIQKTTRTGSLFSANSLDKFNTAGSRPLSAPSHGEASEDTILPSRHIQLISPPPVKRAF